MGSHAAHLLLRSGVGRLRLIDFDQVSLSSLNRHALATRADVGMPKATCLQVCALLAEATVDCVQFYFPCLIRSAGTTCTHHTIGILAISSLGLLRYATAASELQGHLTRLPNCLELLPNAAWYEAEAD